MTNDEAQRQAEAQCQAIGDLIVELLRALERAGTVQIDPDSWDYAVMVTRRYKQTETKDHTAATLHTSMGPTRLAILLHTTLTATVKHVEREAHDAHKRN